MTTNLSSYLQGFRPVDSLGYVVVALIGAGSFTVVQGVHAAQILLETFLIAEALMGSLFLLNNRFDYAEDRTAGRRKVSRNPVSSGLISTRRADFLSLALAALGLLATIFWIGTDTSIILYATTWIIGLLYSAPPIRLKSRAGLDLLCHGAVVIALFFVGLSFANTLTSINITFAIPFLLLSTIYELRNHIKDWAGDTSAGLQTTITTLGPERGRNLLWISIILFWASLIGAAYLLGYGMLILVTVALGSYAVFLILFRSHFELIFDAHLWAVGGIYSAFRILVLTSLI